MSEADLEKLKKRFAEIKKKNDIILLTDKPSYIAGDQVTGVIYGSFVSDITLKSLSLKLSAKEKVHWIDVLHRTLEDGSIEEYTEEHGGKHELFKVVVPVYKPSGGETLTEGQYCWPFAFNLPADIPGTFKYEKGETKATLRYALKAKADVEGKDMDDTVDLTMFERPPPFLQEAHNHDVDKVVVCCCIDRGTVGQTITTDKSTLFPGDVVNVLGDVENNTKYAIKELEVTLNQKITLKADDHVRKEVDDPVKKEFKGLDPHEKATGDNQRHLPLTLPSKMVPSCYGKTITSEWYLRLQSKIDKAFASTPDVEQPVTILNIAPSADQWKAIPIPDGFKQMTPVVLVIPGAPAAEAPKAAKQEKKEKHEEKHEE